MNPFDQATSELGKLNLYDIDVDDSVDADNEITISIIFESYSLFYESDLYLWANGEKQYVDRDITIENEVYEETL